MPELKHFLKSMLYISMLFLFSYQLAGAQDITVQRTHAISTSQLQLNQTLDATGTLQVVAIMVEFQPDTNRLTSGTGLFGSDGMDGLPYLQNAADVRIDPLPHDQNYFEAHLEFAKNYYEKSSDGQLTINYQVLPDIYRLPKKMEAYSPIGETFTNEKLAELARDAWAQVEAGDNFDATGLDPDSTAFIIFHAGVGRDIELTGTNLDITPFDIPSIYLRKDNIRSLLNEPGFNGFPVNDGNFRVTSSLIIPRTESRRGLDIQDNEFVFPLSINGLLIASIGSHLGLPDLFNTETGDPGIGRFGLMDGAGFFAYNGLLPPEPSAWEKIYLGWETPFTIHENTTGDIPLPAGSLNQPNSIARYDLSDSEYFLIENRHRDPDNTGTTITIRKADGTEVDQTFTNQDEAFVFQEEGFDELLEAGIFVDATNFDFSLPGGLDTGENENDPGDDRELNGGILIWHIDESVINATIGNGQVNIDPDRRGIDLEEADGAQDIGKPVPGALNNSAAFGIAFDFWWAENDYRVILESGRSVQLYENRFGPATTPNNNSNSGSPSFFEFHEFSDNLPTATFQIKPAEPFEDLFTLNFSAQLDSSQNFYTDQDPYYESYPLSLSVYETTADTFLIIPSQEAVTAVSISDPAGTQFQLTNNSVQQPLGAQELILATKPEESSPTIDVASLNWNGTLQSFDTTWTATIPKNNGFISSQDGSILHADHTSAGVNAMDGSIVTLASNPFQRSEIIGGAYAEISNNSVTFSPLPGYNFNISSDQNRAYTGNIQLGSRSVFYVLEDDRLSLVDPNLGESAITIFEEEEAEWPAILDDASMIRVNKLNNTLVGINKIGGILNATPIDAPDGITFIGTPLYTDLISSQNEYATLVVGQDDYSMNIYAFHQNGDPVNGFPLHVGRAVSGNTQPIHPIIYEGKLYAVSHKGSLKSWNLTQVTDTKWGSRYGQNEFNKVSARVEDNSSSGNQGYSVLNMQETYNWPNPADDNTNIRFQITPPGGTVEISIITMTGRIIYEETITSGGGFPQEINVNTQNWGSGGYVARVKATVEGRSETKLIKIGVVH